MGFSVKKLTGLSALLCLGTTVGILESFISLPLPVPGIKLGLANLVTLFALCFYDKKSFVTVGFMRVVLTALLWGGFGINFLFSLVGWALSAAAILTACILHKNSIFGISVAGACFHQIGQMMAAVCVYGQIGLLYYLPVLLVAGTLSGILIAFLTASVLRAFFSAVKSDPKI